MLPVLNMGGVNEWNVMLYWNSTSLAHSQHLSPLFSACLNIYLSMYMCMLQCYEDISVCLNQWPLTFYSRTEMSMVTPKNSPGPRQGESRLYLMSVLTASAWDRPQNLRSSPSVEPVAKSNSMSEGLVWRCVTRADIMSNTLAASRTNSSHLLNNP